MLLPVTGYLDRMTWADPDLLAAGYKGKEVAINEWQKSDLLCKSRMGGGGDRRDGSGRGTGALPHF